MRPRIALGIPRVGTGPSARAASPLRGAFALLGARPTPRAASRLRGALGLALVGMAVGLGPGAASAADGDDLRGAGGFNLGVTHRLHTGQAHGLEIDGLSQSYGFSLGADVTRYIGVELAASQSQTDLQLRGQKIGEYGMFSLIPQVRLRYPLFDGRLAPYVLAGVGVSHNEFGDRKSDGAGVSVHARDTRVAGSVGIGAEYHLADNVSVGAELRYLASRDHEIEVEGRRQRLNLDSLIAQARLRVLLPEGTAAETADYRTDGRWYLAVRYGGSITTHEDIGSPFEAHPALDALGGAVDQLIAFSVGWDFARHLGVDIALGGYSPRLVVSGVGSVAEYAMYYVIPQLRARFPMMGGRLVPYLLAGVGASYMEVKDLKPRGWTLGVRTHGIAVAGAVGAGLDYMMARNVALGVELEYLISRGHTLPFEHRARSVNLDALLMTGGVRIFFGPRAVPFVNSGG